MHNLEGREIADPPPGQADMTRREFLVTGTAAVVLTGCMGLAQTTAAGVMRTWGKRPMTGAVTVKTLTYELVPYTCGPLARVLPVPRPACRPAR